MNGRLVKLLAQYNLVVEFVPPDGNCLFHTFSFLESSRTMMEWREVLCNRIQQKADTGNNHQGWVSRANILQPESRKRYADFNSWIMAMRQFEWGNSDFITEFCCELQAEVYCFLRKVLQGPTKVRQGPMFNHTLILGIG